jgi:hypothetical protein
VPLGLEPMPLGRELLQTRLGLCEGGGDAVALGAAARDLCALVASAVTALRGLVFPLRATGCDCGALAPHAGAAHPHGRRPGGGLGWRGRCAQRLERWAA